jgi:hypothetical protein
MRNEFRCFAKLTGCFAKFRVSRNSQFRMFRYFKYEVLTCMISLFVLPFMIITTSVAEPRHFYASPAPIKNVDAAPDPAAPAPILLYS